MTAPEGYVYRWTCTVNGMMYVGSHNGSNPKYVGSGLRFRRAVQKYGIDKFVREIYYTGADFRQVEDYWLKQLDAANDPMYYNMKNEALGMAMPGELNPMHRSHGRVDSPETRRKKGWARGTQQPEISKRMSGANNPMFGRTDQAKGWVAHAKSIKGKTLEEIYGHERAAQLRAQRSQPLAKPHDWHEVVCPHCGSSGRGPNMSRYHFDNCHGTAEDRHLVWRRQRRIGGELVCPHCGIAGGSQGKGKSAMIRWHFDNCKYRATAVAKEDSR